MPRSDHPGLDNYIISHHRGHRQQLPPPLGPVKVTIKLYLGAATVIRAPTKESGGGPVAQAVSYILLALRLAFGGLLGLLLGLLGRGGLACVLLLLRLLGLLASGKGGLGSSVMSHRISHPARIDTTVTLSVGVGSITMAEHTVIRRTDFVCFLTLYHDNMEWPSSYRCWTWQPVSIST